MRDVAEVMEILKEIRKKNGITVPKVSEYLQKETGNQISTKTIYGWEEGTARPDIMSFVAMCNLYGISNISELFSEGFEVRSVDIAMRDKLYKAYRNKPDMQEAARVLLGIE